MPKLLVTGANGVLGRAVLQVLAPAGDAEVVAAVRSDRAAERVRELELEVTLARLHDHRVASWSELLHGVDAVAHTVGILKESPGNRYRDAHEGSVAGLCEAAMRAGCTRVVYLSILGAAPESSNPCLASKARAERLLLDVIPTSLVLRLPMVLGGGDPASRALRTRALRKRAWLLGGGRVRDQPIDVRDAAAAIARALLSAEPCGVLELAGPEAITQRALLERVATRLGRRPAISGVPAGLARAAAWLAERLLRNPSFSLAMLDVLLQDDAVDTRDAWGRLGLSPHSLDESLDHWFPGENA